MSKDPAILQYEAWRNIVNSPDWKYFRDLIQEHINFLQGEIYIAVRDEKFNQAMKAQAKAEDWKKVVDNVNTRLKELKGSIETD